MPSRAVRAAASSTLMVPVTFTRWVPTQSSTERWTEARTYRYSVAGANRAEMIVTRL